MQCASSLRIAARQTSTVLTHLKLTYCALSWFGWNF